MSEQSETPRTCLIMNQIAKQGIDQHVSATKMAEHARTLKRELNEGKKTITAYEADITTSAATEAAND